MTTPANTIYQQLRDMSFKALIDWGVLNKKSPPTITNNGLTLRLKSAGYVPWKGYIEISYDEGFDLYNIEFYRIRKPRRTKANPFTVEEKKVDYEIDGVYFDQLVATIDRQVLSRG